MRRTCAGSDQLVSALVSEHKGCATPAIVRAKELLAQFEVE